MKKRSVGSLLFIALVLVIMYLPIAVVVVYSFNANTARIPIAFTGWTIKMADGTPFNASRKAASK